jgi:hypothetical protein
MFSITYIQTATALDPDRSSLWQSSNHVGLIKTHRMHARELYSDPSLRSGGVGNGSLVNLVVWRFPFWALDEADGQL